MTFMQVRVGRAEGERGKCSAVRRSEMISDRGLGSENMSHDLAMECPLHECCMMLLESHCQRRRESGNFLEEKHMPITTSNSVTIENFIIEYHKNHKLLHQ